MIIAVVVLGCFGAVLGAAHWLSAAPVCAAALWYIFSLGACALWMATGAQVPAARRIPVVWFFLGATFGRKPRPTDRPVIYACEPHGLACCHLALFANPGAELPPEQTRRIRVVSTPLTFLVPLVRLAYSLVGIVTSDLWIMSEILANGDSLALSPSGVAGKEHAVRSRDAADGRISILRPRRIPGFVRLAARHRCLVVPVLSPDENLTFHKLDSPLVWWPLVPMWGRWFFGSVRERVVVECGEPIDFADISPDDTPALLQATEDFYAALAAMAPAGRRVRVDFDKKSA